MNKQKRKSGMAYLIAFTFSVSQYFFAIKSSLLRGNTDNFMKCIQMRYRNPAADDSDYSPFDAELLGSAVDADDAVPENNCFYDNCY
jgi:hypothetical protein